MRTDKYLAMLIYLSHAMNYKSWQVQQKSKKKYVILFYQPHLEYLIEKLAHVQGMNSVINRK